jgi:hypothetical protein
MSNAAMNAPYDASELIAPASTIARNPAGL